MKRREFLQQTAAAAATLGCFPATLSAIERETNPGQIERRAYGRTSEKVSILAFGGIVLNRSTPEKAAALVREAAMVTLRSILPNWVAKREIYSSVFSKN